MQTSCILDNKMSQKNKIVLAVHKRHINTIRCKLSIVDIELFRLAFYLVNGKITIVGTNTKVSCIAFYHSSTVITMTEQDWKLLHKAKPLILKCFETLKMRGEDFEKTGKVLRLL